MPKGRPKKVKIKDVVETTENSNLSTVSGTTNEKEVRRKFLLDLQDTLAREKITGLSDIERKLEELERSS